MDVELWLVIDADGNYECGVDLDTALERYNEGDTTSPQRVVCVTVTLPAPEAVQVAVTLPAESSECVVSIK